MKPFKVNNKIPNKSGFHMEKSSREMGFFNLRSQLDSTIVTYCPMQLKNGEDR